jgi:MoxR-like ATPase
MPSSGDSITAQIDALTKRAEAASILAERVDNLIIEIEQLKNRPQVVIRSGPNFTGSGKVSIGGTELPHFDIAMMGEWSVPEISPTYDIDGWLARFECGDLKRDFTLGQVMRAVMTGTPTRLIGPPATGKTSGIMQACAHMGVPARVIQCGKGLTEYTLLGEQTIEAGSVVWKDGILPTLCRSVNPDAPAVIVFDEIDHLTAPIQSLLHGVLEGRTLDLPNGEKITIPENVICVATANTYGTGDITGRHAAASVSDDAFISRWTRTFSVEYLNPTAERELLLSYGVPDSRINGLMKFVIGTRDQAKQIDRGDISDGIRTPVTLRTLIPMAQECASGGDFVDAFVTTVMGQFSPDEMPKVRELVRSTMAF